MSVTIKFEVNSYRYKNGRGMARTGFGEAVIQARELPQNAFADWKLLGATIDDKSLQGEDLAKLEDWLALFHGADIEDALRSAASGA